MSEIKQINTGVAELLAVKVPEKSCWFETRPGQGIAPPVLVYNFGPNKFMSEVVHLPPGNWTPLGIDTELTEEQCRKVMPAQVRLLPRLTDDLKELVRTEPVPAKEAFASLMQVNGCYSVNPYRNPDATNVLGASPSGSDYEVLDERRDQWQQAEANTGTWIVLKRI